MNTQHKVECSWCNQESGATSKPGTSHTICERHKAQLIAEYRRDSYIEQAAHTFCDLERARAYRYPAPVRNDSLEAAWNAPETAWGALRWVFFGALMGLAGVLLVLAMAWEGMP